MASSAALTIFRSFVIPALLICLLVQIPAQAEEPAPKPVQKITPGKVIIPTDRMRRIWGELISLDLSTRTGSFRREADDQVMNFIVMPYAELLHHATLGDLQDFHVGERAIFRLHENEQGEWIYLTYIQDEMNMMHGHKEFYFVDRIDPSTGELICTQANTDQSFIRQKGIVISTDSETRCWKAGKPATFSEIQVGDPLRAKTRGTGSGKARIAWEIFLDEQSLLEFQAKQKAVHLARMDKEGIPGYVDQIAPDSVAVTLFPEGSVLFDKFKNGDTVEIAPAGVDRLPTHERIPGKITEIQKTGRTRQVQIRCSSTSSFKPAGVMRLWTSP